MINLYACAMGSKHLTISRSDQDGVWHFCYKSEVVAPIGKVCRRPAKCKKNECIIVKDLANSVDFLQFRDAEMRVMHKSVLR